MVLGSEAMSYLNDAPLIRLIVSDVVAVKILTVEFQIIDVAVVAVV